MNLVRIGIALMIIGVAILLVTNSFLPRVYNVMTNTLNNVTVSIDVYSRYLIPIYINSPAYIVVLLNNSYPLSVYLSDQFGHVLTPSSYKQVRNAYLITFQLPNHGNYSLVLFNDNPKPLNVSVLITVISQYVVSNALLVNAVMDLGAVIFIVGALLVLINVLFIARYKLLKTR
ncbi:hypothetical protein [Vulcanisaeta distributa]|uniref:Uncharacterized protein n=1 Tax=Vulcanisaeta distributa (strain DSM 14429 / JCM 11212 / NBRC 100878 / IC-017) TaxID=572478 RepID=E1QTK3_VULDI|nr:hypothetical protein [Vulcanisaeta distributa]ADN49718.1 hypothetical protein Vdis_0311 [Vulcanisaeta distributa DSM 14429]